MRKSIFCEFSLPQKQSDLEGAPAPCLLFMALRTALLLRLFLLPNNHNHSAPACSKFMTKNKP